MMHSFRTLLFAVIVPMLAVAVGCTTDPTTGVGSNDNTTGTVNENDNTTGGGDQPNDNADPGNDNTGAPNDNGDAANENGGDPTGNDNGNAGNENTDAPNDNGDGVNENGSDPQGNDNGDPGNDNGAANDNGSGDDNGDAGNDNSPDPIDPGGPTSGEYVPGEMLDVTGDGFSITIPPDAAQDAFTLTVESVGGADLPAPPTGMTLVAVDLGPSGQQFDQPVRVTLTLSEPTIATELPALTYDEQAGAWVGTGSNAVVLEGGTQARFDIDHFSLVAIPDLVLPPAEGDPIGTFIVLSNDGVFKSEVISSDRTALVYSDIGDSFNISLTSQDISDMGMIETASLGLNAVSVTILGNRLIAAIGGGLSLLNEGQFNAPVVGVVIMSVTGGSVSASAYLATPDKAFAATLNSP